MPYVISPFAFSVKFIICAEGKTDLRGLFMTLTFKTLRLSHQIMTLKVTTGELKWSQYELYIELVQTEQAHQSTYAFLKSRPVL